MDADLIPLYPTLEVPSVTLSALPDGVAGVAATLGAMVAMTKQYRSNAVIHQLASNIVAGLPGKSYFDEAASVQNYVRNAIRYTMDTYDTEVVQSPLVTLSRGQGDCDDQSLLVGALLQAVGHPVRYVAFSVDNGGGHVFTETYIGNRWYSVETTEPVPVGWWPADASILKIATV